MSATGEQTQDPASEHATDVEEEEQVVIRRSTRVRKPVIKQPTKIPGDSDSDSVDDEPVRRRRRRKTITKTVEADETPATEAPTPKRKRKRATEENGEGGEKEEEQPPPKKRDNKKKEATTDAEDPPQETEEAPPKKKRSRKKAAPAPVEETETKEHNGDMMEVETSPQPKEEAASPGHEGTDNAADQPAKPKRVRKPKPKEPIVYVIPDVERKNSTFRGRLGYACINTVLRVSKPPVLCSRTCRLDTIVKSGLDHVKELGRQNIKDLITLIEWNEKNNIRFMRMSSDMFPFASHATHGYDLSFAAEELKAAGDLAKKYGHRLTMHPGQFTQIASHKDNVVEQSIKDLEYHAEMMDRMGLDQDSVMIIHMGGVYGDKTATLARFKENYEKKLSDAIKRRLVLENDEICYNVDDLLKVCPQLGIPIVFDWHHHSINPSRRSPEELIPIINQTWQARNIKPKQHLSEPRPGAVTAMELRAHADRCTSIPLGVPDDMDLMIEAKDKEQAVFELYRIYGLQDVIHENLRPPADDITIKTKGRKSTGKKKTQKEGEAAPEVPEQPIDPEMIDELADDDDLII